MFLFSVRFTSELGNVPVSHAIVGLQHEKGTMLLLLICAEIKYRGQDLQALSSQEKVQVYKEIRMAKVSW